MVDMDELIAEARDQAAYLRGVSRDGSMPYSGELLESLADALESVRAERDAALELMNQHKCGENVEAAYRRAVDAEARIAELEKSRDRWEELCGKIASEKYDLNARIAEGANCDRDRMGICKRCGMGWDARKLLDGDFACPVLQSSGVGEDDCWHEANCRCVRAGTVDEEKLAEVIGSLDWGYMVDGPSVSEVARAVAEWLNEGENG